MDGYCHAVSDRQLTPDPFGPIAFSPDGEHWFEYGPPGERRRVGFHDYAAIYAVPGLYERVFYEELDMCSASVVVGLLGEQLAARGVDPDTLRALDFGAGNGAGGELLRELGVPSVVGLDLEPQAKVAAERDRPGVYHDYLVLDLGAASPEQLDDLRRRGFSALIAVAALGMGHVPAGALERAIGLVEPGGWVAFAVEAGLMPNQAGADARASGFPAVFESLTGGSRGELVAQHPYRHRLNTDGSDHPAVALVARLAS